MKRSALIPNLRDYMVKEIKRNTGKTEQYAILCTVLKAHITVIKANSFELLPFLSIHQCQTDTLIHYT